MEPFTDEPTRRSLLAGATVVGAAIAACGCGATLSGCALEKKNSAITTGTVNIGPASQFPAGTANTTLMPTYGIVVVNDSGVPLAIRPKCTHQGCTVAWKPEHYDFECPCHGSKFDLLGQVIHGPAKKPLAAVPTQKQPDGTLTVNLDQLYAIPV